MLIRVLSIRFYASGHGSLGSPTARYVKEIIPTILDQPGVTGAMVFTMVHPCGFVDNGWPQGDECSGCPGPSGAGGYPCQALVELCAKGCAVRDAFGAAALGQG